MYEVSFINEMNIYENREIYENPILLESYEETSKLVFTLITQGYVVSVKKIGNDENKS